MCCVKKALTVIVILTLSFLCGCSKVEELHINYSNYNAEVELTCFADNENNTKIYNMDITKSNGNYNINIFCDNVRYELKFANGVCELINPKYEGKVIIEGTSCFSQLYREIDFSSFIEINTFSENVIKANEGEIQYVLEFDESTKILKALKIYENSAIIKNYEYKKIDIME